MIFNIKIYQKKSDENRYVKHIPNQTNENMQPNNDYQGYIHPDVAPNE